MSQRQQQRQRRQRELQQQVETLRQQVAEQHGVQAGTLQLAVVPANRRRLANLPEHRRRQFRDRLMQIVSRAAESRCGPPPVATAASAEPPGEADSSPASEAELLGQVCATCRGRCCAFGADHAYIDVDTVARFMARHPQLRPRDVLKVYLERLANKTYQGSCLFHGAQGCTLSRDMRSPVCNDFQCAGLGQLQQKIAREGERPTVVVSVSDTRDVVRMALVEERSLRGEWELMPGETARDDPALAEDRSSPLPGLPDNLL